MKRPPVTLPALTSSLPALATEVAIIGHAKKADLLFTREEFTAMCERMRNGNPPNCFLMGYCDKTGTPKFARAHKANADHRIGWSYDTITGRSKMKTSIGFYPRNGDGNSQWAALDFDAHDGDKSRARALALKAFGILLQHPELYLVLCTSGSHGWHLFIFTFDFHPVGDWSRLLRNVADLIGAPIEKGVCEIFPDDNQRGLGSGIRAPGTWNAKTDGFDLIVYESLTKLLSGSVDLKRDASLSTRSNAVQPQREGQKSLTYKESPLIAANVLPNKELYRGERGEWKQLFAISAARSRHDKLAKLVGTAFYQAGRTTTLENARFQHAEANPSPATPLADHISDFDQLWAGMERKWLSELSHSERQKFDVLTVTEREAFRIIRNWSCADSADDFKIVAENLGFRLGVTLQTACNIRRRLCAVGILRKTAEYVPHQLAARYQWRAALPHRSMENDPLVGEETEQLLTTK